MIKLRRISGLSYSATDSEHSKMSTKLFGRHFALFKLLVA